jgi:ubiquinone/menaquinone biosynthesis C-methylase UbiE
MLNIDKLKTKEWNDSYERGENHFFKPCAELVCFVSHYLRRRISWAEFEDVLPGAQGNRVLDVGCGIGRNLIFGAEWGFEMYGNDLSSRAVEIAREGLGKKKTPNAKDCVIAGDIRSLPWGDKFFAHAFSDRTLDSMRFEFAQEALSEIARVVKPGGYFYCSLISGDQSGYDPNFCGEEVVADGNEIGTFRSFFNRTKVGRLVEPLFEILSCRIHRTSDSMDGTHRGIWHVISRRRQL